LGGIAIADEPGVGVVSDWLKLDRAVSSQVRVHGWEKVCALPFVAAPGAHDAVEIALVESGVVKYEIAGSETIVREGNVFVVPRGVVHRTSFLTPVRAIALWLGADFVAEVGDALAPHGSRPSLASGVATASTKRVRALLDLLVDEVNGAAAGHVRAAEALSESVVIEVLRHAPQNTSVRDPRVMQAIAQMNEAFDEPLGIDDLAKTARMSRFHFSRLFRDETGQAPYQYLLRVRVAKAAEMLRGGHCSVTEAALACGFTDLSRFARTFKKHTGKSPSNFGVANRTKRAARIGSE
jgi:AraC-like DNA-binding protein